MVIFVYVFMMVVTYFLVKYLSGRYDDVFHAAMEEVTPLPVLFWPVYYFFLFAILISLFSTFCFSGLGQKVKAYGKHNRNKR